MVDKLKKIFPKLLVSLVAFSSMLVFQASAPRLPEQPLPVVEVRVLTLYDVCVEGTIVPAARLQAHACAESDERDDAVGDGGQSRSRFQLYEKYHAYRAARYGEYDVNDPAQAGRIAALYIQETMRAFPGDEDMQMTAYAWGIEGARRHGVDAEYVRRVREGI